MAGPRLTILAASGVCGARGAGPDLPGWVAVEDGRVSGVSAGPPPARAVDLGEVILGPGFVDLQVNGVGAVDFARAPVADIRRALAALARAGVTACCPTLVTAAPDAYAEPLRRLAEVAADPRDGEATVLGVHLEGPFLGAAPGAHRRDLVRRVDLDWLEGLLSASPGLVRIVTLAPEADPGERAIAELSNRGIVVALGHSTASYDTGRRAADAGATVATHLFNGMGPLHQREPGLVGVALDDPRLHPSVIADLVHVHPAVLRLVIGAKRGVMLVSDSVAVGGDRTGDAARLADGTLAGATVLLDRAVRNVVGLGVPLVRAVEMAATVPAEVLGLRDRGRIAPGTRADLVALDRETLEVRHVWIGGVPVDVEAAAC